MLAAYAAVDPDGHWDPAQAAVYEETGAGQPLPQVDGQPHPLGEQREAVEQQILGDLLRLNGERAGE